MEPTVVQPEPALSPMARDMMPSAPTPPPAPKPRRKAKPLPERILEITGSLKLTVILFALSIVIIFFGTLAQKEVGIWTAVNDYFRSAWVWIPMRVLFFFSLPEKALANNWSIPFPGGWTVGTALLANLTSAFSLKVYRLIAGPGDFDVKLAAFGKKSGIYLLHLGVVVMMAGEVITGHFSEEGMMSIRPNESVNFTQKTTELELAVTDVTNPDRKVDDIVAIYQPSFVRAGTISHKDLPFDVAVAQFMKNAELRRLPEGEVALADAGRGKDIKVVEKPPVGGAEKESDLSAIIIELKEKTHGQPRGKYLLSMVLKPEQIEFNGKTYELELRPRRDYRDFFVRLNKAERKDHPNMPMARDYSSWVQLINPKTNEDREVRIYMNVPLRYNGETYYQADMPKNPDGGFTTVLQVVKNPGWLLPYISCGLVALGMLVQFGLHLVGFVSRRVA